MSRWRGWPWFWGRNDGWGRSSPIVPFKHDPDMLELDAYEARAVWLANQVRNVGQWIKNAHDCMDPKVGCSCSGSVNYPLPPRD